MVGCGEMKVLRQYFEKTRSMYLLLAGIVLLAHGSLLFSQRIGIDTELMMEGYDRFTVLGRQGITWLGKVFYLWWFNLYWAEALTVLFMVLAPIAYVFAFSSVGRQDRFLNISLIVFGTAYALSALWATQLYFLNQAAQVACACFLVPVTAVLVEKARENLKKNWVALPAAIGLMQIVFATYQTIILMYIVTVAMLFLLSSPEEKRSLKEDLEWLCYHIAVFFVGFTAYMVIAKKYFMSEADYLEGQIFWKTTDAQTCIQNILACVKRNLGNNPPFYTGLYLVMCVILVGVSIDYFMNTGKKKHGNRIFMVLAELFVMASPFLLFVYAGGDAADRIQFIMPFAQACILYLTEYMLSGHERKDGKRTVGSVARTLVLMILLIVVFRDGVIQASYCNRLYYTDEWVFQHDRAMAQDLYGKIKTAISEVEEEERAAVRGVFVGNAQVSYNGSCFKTSIMGESRFAYSPGDLAKDRAVRLMKALGYPVDDIFYYYSEGAAAYTKEMLRTEMKSDIDAMPSYPADGCVKVLTLRDGQKYMVVKLSDYWWMWGE